MIPALTTMVSDHLGYFAKAKRYRDIKTTSKTGHDPEITGHDRVKYALYLRKILVHGAHAVACRSQRSSDCLRTFVGRIRERAHINVVICTLANKIARVAWALLRSGQDFDATYARRTAVQQ